LGQFVPVKLDAEHEGKGLAAKYAIDGYPTLVVVAPNGEFVERIVGYHPADDFVQTLHLAVSDNTDYPILKAKVAANPTDIATSLKFANLLARREKDKELMPLLTSLEAANEAPKLADIYLRLGDTCVSNNQPTQATTWYDKVINVSTNAKQLLPAHMGLLQMEMAKRDVGGAIAELQSMLDIPNLPKAEKAGIQSMIDQINASASQ
jgi:thioredoxin-like negative regulator of GroEL